jgi:hypothetical protein
MVRSVCSRTAPVVRQHHRGHAPTAPSSAKTKGPVVHDEPTGVRTALQSPKHKPCCPACQQVKHHANFSPTPAGLSSSCQDCQRASSRLASRRRQAAVRLLIAFHPEEYHALLRLVRGGGQPCVPERGAGDAA